MKKAKTRIMTDQMLVVRRILREARERPRGGIDFGCTYTLTRTREAADEVLPESSQRLNLDIPPHNLMAVTVTASAASGRCVHTCKHENFNQMFVNFTGHNSSLVLKYLLFLHTDQGPGTLTDKH